MSDNYLRFWGVRGSYPAPFDSHCKVGGNTSCVAITADGDPGPTLVLDAGTGLRGLGALLPDGAHTFGAQTHPADGNCGITITMFLNITWPILMPG